MNETLEFVTPEQRAAIERAQQDATSIANICKEVADSVLQTIPNATDKAGWNHGTCKVCTRIGKHQIWQIETGTAPSDLDYSDIDYIVFYRQAVRNKHSGEIKAFASWVPCGLPIEVHAGQSFEVKEVITSRWKREDVEAEARKAFLDLQAMCEEFYNREAA